MIVKFIIKEENDENKKNYDYKKIQVKIWSEKNAKLMDPNLLDLEIDITSESTTVFNEINNFLLKNINEKIEFDNNNLNNFHIQDSLILQIATRISNSYEKGIKEIKKNLGNDI